MLRPSVGKTGAVSLRLRKIARSVSSLGSDTSPALVTFRKQQPEILRPLPFWQHHCFEAAFFFGRLLQLGFALALHLPSLGDCFYGY